MNARRLKNKTAVLTALVENWIADERIAQKGYVPTINSGDPSVAIPGVLTKPTIRLAENVVELLSNTTEEEWRWVERALLVLRSGKRVIVTALKSNLQAFAESAEQHEQQRSTDGAKARSGRRSGVDAIDDELGEIERLATEIEEDAKENTAPKKRTARKTGSRRRA